MLPGELGVAENAAPGIDGRKLPHRVVLQQIAASIDRDSILPLQIAASGLATNQIREISTPD
jgi:hypothetical protein